MSSAPLVLCIPPVAARDAVADALIAHGFAVHPIASDALDVSGGSRAAEEPDTPVEEDSPVRFVVRFAATGDGTAVAFEPRASDASTESGAIEAQRMGDAVREAFRQVSTRMAAEGLLAAAPAAAEPVAPAPVDLVSDVPQGVPASPAHPEGATAPAPAAGHPADRTPSPGDTANRTDVASILAIVLGFLVPPGGVVAGAIALARIRRTREKGRGLAITGIVVGSVLSVLAVLSTVALICFFLISANQAETAPFVPPTTPENGGVIVSPGDAEPGDAYALPVGACLDDLPGGYVSADSFVDCAAPHTYEVFGAITLAHEAFPGDEAITAEAEKACDAEFSFFIGVAYDASVFEYTYFAPIEETWADGDRSVSCLVTDPTGETTGTLAGAAR